MRFGFSLIALVAATFAAAQPATKPSINPDPSIARPIADVDVSTPSAETNAKRFAKGLPPLSPKAHRRRPYRLGPHGGTGVDTARRATTSPVPPVSTKCNILVKNAATGQEYGYLSPVWNVFGEYGAFQPGQAGALEVSFSYSPDSPSQIDFVATNTPSANLPYVGAAVGFASQSDDFAPGSFNYAYVVGTEQLPAGPPVEGDNNSFGRATGIPADAESAIWAYDPKSDAITAQWINTDSSTPATHLLYANDGNDAILLTGDPSALNSVFGTEYPEVTFTCVQDMTPVQTPAPEPTFK